MILTGKQEKVEALTEAMELLGQAEELIRSVGSANLNAYAADQINASERVMGEQVFQTVERAKKELERSCPECGSDRCEEVMPGVFACAECETEWRA